MNEKNLNQNQPSICEDLEARQFDLEIEQRAAYQRGQVKKTDIAHSKGRSSQTDGGRCVRQHMVPLVADSLEKHDDWIASKPSAAGQATVQYRKIRRYVEPMTIAHIGITAVIDCLGRGNTIKTTITKVVLEIGKRLQDEAFMSYMDEMAPEYFEKLQGYYLHDPVRRYDKKVYAMQRALERHAEMYWNWMDNEDLARLGSMILWRINSVIINENTGESFFEEKVPDFKDPNRKQRKNKAHKDARYLGWTKTGLYYRDKWQEMCDNANWKPMPMVCPPVDWSLDDEGKLLRGGYINRMPGDASRLIHNNKGSQASQTVLNAINRLQRTGYKVNTYILELMEHLMSGYWEIGNWMSYEMLMYEDEHKPIFDSDYLDSLERTSKEYKEAMRDLTKFYQNQKIDEQKAGSPRRTLEIARMFKDEDAFYTPWFLDTRGRMYPVIEGLSPQGPDYQKALLRSAVSVPVNDDTRKDLLISIATAGAFDNVDKKDYFTRLQWAERFVRTVKFEFMVIQPETYQDWHDADEPWQFLALCKEYYDIFVETDPKLKKTSCDVFCFRDATNSGLQILAGIMRDEKAAYYTNVLATDEPQDAYKLVAESAKNLMRNPEWMRVEFEKRSQSVAAKNKYRPDDDQIQDPGYSFNFEIDVLNRNHTKTQVMTTLYNSSPLTRRENILGALKKKNQVEVDPADKSIVVNSCLVSMSREFEGALNLNQWFQSVARAALEKGAENLKWITPSGMFVVNEYREPEFAQVKTYATGGGHYKTLMTHSEGRVFLRNGWGGVKKSKILSSTSANYIHSLDASIIQLGIQCVPDEVPVYAVHDCIAAVAGTVSGVIPEFRKAFHNIVTSNPLYGLLEENDLIGVLEPPEVGDADISECLESPYMFC